MNSTLSISLKDSWTNSSVSVRSIPKAAPLFNSEAAWRDPSANAFYVWGGTTAYFAQPAAIGLWKFTADGVGGGSWSSVTPSNIVSFSSLVRSGTAAWTQSKNVGYYMGGVATYQTDTSISSDTYLALPGILAYDMTTGSFTNSSTVGFGSLGTLIGGSVEFVPFGKEGLLLFLGGSQAPQVTNYGGGREVDFANLTIYDPAGRTEHKKICAEETADD